MADSLSRRRARFAFGRLRGASDMDGLAQVLKGLPIQVRTQGLSTVLALMMADDGKPGIRAVRELVVGWLKHDDCPAKPLLGSQQGGQEAPPDEALLRWCIEAGNGSYRAVQAEAAALLDQAKLLAAALAAARKDEQGKPRRAGRTDG